MAETRTARMRLVHWSAGTDSPQRVDFNETFLSIEDLAAIDQQGVEQDRPLPNKRGMYYFATDKGILYRSDGLAWAVVGSSTLSQLVRSARSDAVAMTIQAIAGQTADLLRATSTSGATYVRVRSNGDVLAGPVRISQAARTTTTADAAPTDSAVTVDNASTGMWNHTAKNTTGNTAGYYRAVRGTSTVFQVAPDGSVTTPAVTLTSAPTSDSHAVRRLDLNAAVAGRTYALTSDQLTGQLPVSKGGTGGTTQATARSGIGAAAAATVITAGEGLVGGGALTASRTLRVQFAVAGTVYRGSDQGSSAFAARYDHTHALDDGGIVGVLPVSKGGTGGTSAQSARDSLYVPPISRTISAGVGLTGGGSLLSDRTINISFAGSGSANTVARSDHTHDINSSSVTGTLSIAGGGTGRSSASPGAYPRWNAAGDAFEGVTPTNLRTDIGAATSGHGHALTDANITGTLPISQGGTGATTHAAARDTLNVPYVGTSINANIGLQGGGDLSQSRNISVRFAGTGSSDTVARSDHEHDLSREKIVGKLPWEKMPDTIELGNGVDLDTLTDDADYSQSSSAEAAGGANYPTGAAGLLQVRSNHNSAMIYQFYNAYNTSNGAYWRTKYNSIWYGWRKIMDDADIDALSNVYAAKVHGHALTDSNITGILPVAQGGTGSSNVTSARTALGVPWEGRTISAGAGLSGGGNLTANRTLQVVFEGSGTKTTAARSDHGHALTDANLTGTLPVSQGGTGHTTLTSGSYLVGNGTGLPILRTPAQVRSNIGALAADRQAFAHSNGIGATGWNTYSAGQIVTPLASGGAGVTLEFMMARTGATFTQGTDYMTHGYVSTTFRPNHTSGTYFPIMIGTELGLGFIKWTTGEFMARAASGAVTISPGARISANLSWGRV